LRDGLFHIESKDWERLFWLTSQFGQLGQEKQLLEQAQEMHEFIRETVRKAFGSDIAESVSILTAEA
jgi:triosephosphate isomerase